MGGLVHQTVEAHRSLRSLRSVGMTRGGRADLHPGPCTLNPGVREGYSCTGNNHTFWIRPFFTS
jgi:hypothetical protein